MLDRPDLVRLLVAVFWLWEDIETEWLADACYMSVRDTIEVAEAESPVAFNCLDCGVEFTIGGRQHLIDRLRSYKAFHKGETQGTPRALLCTGCIKRRDQNDKRQRTVDQKRYRAMLHDYRNGPYSERRMTKEWELLKKAVHSRDGYRCRMCNRKDLPLHLHHRTYVGYAQERLEDLITLCEDCHFLFHAHSEVS